MSSEERPAWTPQRAAPLPPLGELLPRPLHRSAAAPSVAAVQRYRSWLDLPVPLKSWTRTVPAAEALALIAAVSPGEPLDAWAARADGLLPQSEPSYRQTLLRLVERLALVVEDGTIVESPLLKLLLGANEQRRHDLFTAAYALAHPWTLLACRQLVLPRLDEDGVGAQVSIEAWDQLIARFSDGEATEASRRKTRSTLIGVLQQLGVVERDSHAGAPTRLRRGQPDAVAFGWVLADQLATELCGEATMTWVGHFSDAAMLYALEPEQAAERAAAAVRARVLKKAELDGSPGVGISAAWGFHPTDKAASAG